MASAIQLIQIGTTASARVTCHPRRRRMACRRAISEKITAVVREKVCWVISTSEELVVELQGRRTLGRLLSSLLPYQPVHCFLPCVEPGEFASGEGLQRLVEDVGQALSTYNRGPLYVWPVEDGNFLHSGDRIAPELSAREVAQGEHRVARLRGHDALYFFCDYHDLF